MGTSPDELRAQIESTREELAGDVDRLADRTNPRRVAKRKTRRVRGAVTGIRDRVMGTTSEVAHQSAGQVRYMQDRAQQTARQTARSVREGAGQAADTMGSAAGQAADTMGSAAGQAGEAVKAAPGQAMRQTSGNPLAAGLVAFGAGALVASLLPESQTERRAAGQLSDRAGELVEPVREAAVESARRLGGETADSARQAAEQVKETGGEAAKATGEQAREQAEQVKEQAKDSGRSVAGKARGNPRRPAG